MGSRHRWISTFLAALIALNTPIASTGATAAATLHDLRLLLDAATVSSNSKFHLIVPAAICARLAVMTTATIGGLCFPQLTVNGGVIGGIVVHASDALTNTVVLVDASRMVAAADPVGIRVSTDAALEMETAPSMTANSEASPPAISAQNVVSMFQTNSVAILVERIYGFSMLRSTAAQSLSGVSWGT